MKPRLLKRMSAYLIDLLLLGTLITLIYYFIPEPSNTLELQSQLNNLNDGILSQEITFSDFINDYVTIMYELDNGRIIYSVINFVMIFMYFVIIPFITKGRTLGNYIMSIKIKNRKNDSLSFIGLIARNFIINGLGYLIAQIILINLITANLYFYVLTILAFIQILLVIISIFMIKCRKDKRGLHDILSGTVVINAK